FCGHPPGPGAEVGGGPVSSGGCVEWTHNHAFSLGYYTVIVENCCQGMATSHEEAVKRMGRHGVVTGYEDVVKAWEKMAQ
ncbi:hypothetical protein ACFLU4_05480, partial [Chloroflexota bacterium]